MGMFSPDENGWVLEEEVEPLRKVAAIALAMRRMDERQLNGELKELTEGSFVDVKPDPRKKDLEYKLDLLKAGIAFKQESAKAAERRRDNANARAKILDAINCKKDDALSQASMFVLDSRTVPSCRSSALSKAASASRSRTHPLRDRHADNIANRSPFGLASGGCFE